MQTIRIYRLNGLARSTRERLRVAQMEAARVWNVCRELHQTARLGHQPWPDRHALQRATKGGQFALHSQSIQMVCHQFLANVETTRQLKPTHPRMRYPYKPKQYMTVQWPAQAIARQGKRLILPMGRGSQGAKLPPGPARTHQGRLLSLEWVLRIACGRSFPGLNRGPRSGAGDH